MERMQSALDHGKTGYRTAKFSRLRFWAMDPKMNFVFDPTRWVTQTTFLTFTGSFDSRVLKLLCAILVLVILIHPVTRISVPLQVRIWCATRRETVLLFGSWQKVQLPQKRLLTFINSARSSIMRITSLLSINCPKLLLVFMSWSRNSEISSLSHLGAVIKLSTMVVSL